MSLGLAGATAWLVGLDGFNRLLAIGFGGVEQASFYVLLIAAGIGGLYAAVVSGLVAFRSGKTVSVEIFFFSLWAFCQTFELAKFGSAALGATAGAGSFELVTRVALFGRYAGTISVFSGSLFSIGLKQERGLPMFSVVMLAGLLFASVHPLNSVGPGRDFLADRGLVGLAGAFELTIVLMTLVNYLIAWRVGKDTAYLRAGAGVGICVVTAMMLRTTETLWIALGALPALAFGTWLHIKSLHDYYLWR